MAQELRLVPRDPNYINPYRKSANKEVCIHFNNFFFISGKSKLQNWYMSWGLNNNKKNNTLFL